MGAIAGNHKVVHQALPSMLLLFELLMKLGWHPLVLRSEALLRRVVQTCLGVLKNALFVCFE